VTDRLQVNLRLDRELLTELDELAGYEHLDRPELARRILREGVARHREERAIQEYASGRVTAWRAAEMAGTSLYDMLDRIHERGVVHEMDPEELEQIRRLPIPASSALAHGKSGGQRRVAESTSQYGSESTPSSSFDAEAGIDALRTRYRPSDVRTLMVGESSPAGGTHFYRANSNLFRAVRDAFVIALAPAAVPNGQAFLAFFAAQGYWLVDVADQPVNHLSGTARREAVEAGVTRLRETIEEAHPQTIIAVKATVGQSVREAAETAHVAAAVDVLPFPVRQWRAAFVERLAAIVAVATTPEDVTTQRITEADIGRGQVRIPSTGRAKSYFPPVRQRIDLVLRGERLSVGYDPHYDPDQQRSGVLRIGSRLASLVKPEERLRISRAPDGTVSLD
jgi:predicted HTH domain antitoxin